MPFNQSAAISFVDNFKKFFQFQSTLAFAKNPPPTDQYEPVDIWKGMDNIRLAAEQESYTDHYDFEKDIRILLGRLNDGHVAYTTNCLEGKLLYPGCMEISADRNW